MQTNCALSMLGESLCVITSTQSHDALVIYQEININIKILYGCGACATGAGMPGDSCFPTPPDEG